MKPATIYARVSTTKQATDGVSLDAQEAKALAWAALNECTVRSVYRDAGISGKRADNRPGLQAALAEVCESGGVLVVYSLSRLARSTRDACEIADRLARAGADLVSLSEKLDTTTAAGKMIFRMLAVLSEFEREQIGERTAAVLAYKASLGERVGEIPYGSRLAADGVHVEPDETERATLADLRRMRADGWTWARIADELNARGLSTKKGQVWTWQTARRAALAA